MVKVFIYVISVNEFIFKFNKLLFMVFVVENVLVGQFVIQIYVIDLDKGFDGEIVFLLVGESKDQGFKFDRLIGVLSVLGGLDNEKVGVVIFCIFVKNVL